jgi:hypothetical protein
VDPQCLGQHVVDRDTVVPKLLLQCMLGMGLVEMGRRRDGVAQPLLRLCRCGIWSRH